MEKGKDDVGAAEAWKDFLNTTYTNLSSYQSQVKYESTYNMVDFIEAWPNRYESDLSASQFDELENVVKLALRKQSTFYRTSPKDLLIKGHFVKLSDFKKYKNEIGKDIEELERVTFFALNTAFVDDDLIEIGKQFEVIIIAPKWEVIGERKINLEGSQGEAHALRKAAINIPGLPGLPGGPGGNFFGIAKNIINGSNLTISVKGGQGGPGQIGGDGIDGTDGFYADLEGKEEPHCSEDLCQNNKIRTKASGRSGIEEWEFVCNNDPKGGSYVGSRTECTLEIYSEQGDFPTHGGDGGAGGKGGYPGTLELLQLENKPQVHKIKTLGKKGTGGKGGEGGKYGLELNYSYTWRSATFRDPGMPTPGHSKWHCDKEIPKERSGKRNEGGITGYNFGTQENLEPGMNPKLKKFEGAGIIIGDYKDFLRNQLVDTFLHDFSMDFLNHLDNDKSIESTYDTLAYANELIHLEKQLHKHKGKINFLPFYKSLLKRTGEYARTSEEIKTSKVSKTILSYTYTNILSRIHYLSNPSEPDLILDITTRVSSMKEDFKNFREVQQEKARIDRIIKNTKKRNDHKEEYNEVRQGKIDEATKFTQTLDAELHNEMEVIDREINSLIDQIKSKEWKTAAELEEYDKKTSSLGTQIAWRTAFGGFRVGAQLLNFAGPYGATANLAIQATTNLIEPLVLGGTTDQAMIERSRNLAKQLDSLIKDVNDDKFIILTSAISGTVSDDNKQKLEAKIKALTRDNDKPEDLVKTFKEVANLGNEALDVYLKHANSQKEVDALNAAVKGVKAQLKFLKDNEKQIYENIVGRFQDVRKDLTNVVSSLHGKSRVSLVMTKWQVQRSLSDMKNHIQGIVSSLELQNKAVYTIGHLQDAIDTMIGVYDHIQNYQEQQVLADYIADISSVDVDDLDIPEGQEQYAKFLTELQFALSANLMLDRYQSVSNAFQQFMFPSMRFKPSTPPSLNIASNKGLQKFIEKIADETDDLDRVLQEEKTSSTDQNVCAHRDIEFKYGEPEGPFVTWKGSEFQSDIKRLLSGEEIRLKADVKKSDPSKEAIKFTKINLNFRAHSKELQNKLINVLQKVNIHLNHLGESYYRFDDRIYKTTTPNQKMEFTFAKKDNGDPKNPNEVYTKIARGHYMLSPYTYWTIRLQHLIHDPYVINNTQDIDLELEGLGRYFTKDCLRPEIEKYKSLNLSEPIDIRLINQKIKDSPTNELFRSKRELGMGENQDYVTNSASSSISSPFNHIFNWLKMSSLAFASQMLILMNSVPETVQEIISVEQTEYQSEELAESEVHDDEIGVGNEIFYDALDNFDDTNTQNIYLDADSDYNGKYTDYIGSTSNSTHDSRMLLAHEKTADTKIVSNPEGFGLLMLADLFARSITGEKYQTTRFVSPSEKRAKEIQDIKHRVFDALNHVEVASKEYLKHQAGSQFVSEVPELIYNAPSGAMML